MATLVSDALSWWVRSRPEGVAFIVGDEQVTYGELGGWTDQVAHLLADRHGVGPGDVVAVAGANSLEWVIAAIGAVKTGAIVTPVNYRYTANEIEYLVRDCSPKVVLSDDQEADKFRTVFESTGEVPIVAFADITARRGATAPAFHVDVDPDAPMVLAYTSGTTGLPKGLVYTNETILAALFELILKDPTTPDATTLLMVLPLFSVAGIMHCVLHTVSRGSTAVVMRDFDPAKALELIVAHRVSHMNGVPLIYEAIARQPGFTSHDLSHIKMAQVGGARVSQELLAAWIGRGVALRHMYGMTEIGGCATVPRPADALAYHELCGDGSIFTEVRTMRPDGTFCKPGEEGEIVMRGPAMMLRYWSNEQATNEAIVDGWLHSGDLGVLDENGYLRYVDRLKDMVISGGFNVSPSEVEGVIGAIPGVHEVAVIAVADEKWGEAPAAIVNACPELTEDDVVAAAREKLASFKVPKYVVFAEAPLPRMASGKLAKRKLREDYAHLANTR
jgi:fatty-acyl-CoA synthase